MRGTLFPFTRGRLSTAVLLVTTSSACLDGCAERAGLVSARGYAERGELREAYREYHQAYLESDDPRDREARDRLGVEISDLLARQALEKERAGDLPGSLAGYLHALEYDPAREDLIASLIGIEERLFRLAEVTREAGSRKGTWEAYRLWHDFRKQEPTPGVVWAMGEAAAAAADAEIAALTSEGTEVLTDARGGPEGSDLSLSLPGDAVGLTRRLAGVRDLASRLEAIVLEGGPAAPWLEDLLAQHRALLAGLERALERALRGEAERALAAVAEEAGDIHGAAQGYRRALLLWPDRSKIRAGLDRALEALVRRSCARARSALASGRWDEALGALKTLSGEPGGERVSNLASRCRNEIRAGLLTEGARLRERGLPGSALVLFLRARGVGPWPELEREIGSLEDEVRARHSCEVGVDLSPIVEEDERLAAIFWGEDVVRTLVEEVRRTFPLAPDSTAPTGEPLEGPQSGDCFLSAEVEDLEFLYRREKSPGGLGESRFVADFSEGINPERVRAEEELRVARQALEKARAALACAGPGEREGAAALLTIAEGRERQASATCERSLATVPVPVWKKETYPVVKVRVESSLALLVRIEGRPRWLEARTAAEGQEVEGDASRGIAPQAPDVPSRDDALRTLSARLAQKLDFALKERRDARLHRLLERGIARIQTRACEEAVEDLVAFLYARRGEDQPPGFRRAAEALRRTTGLDLESAWAAQPGQAPVQGH